MLPSNLLLKHSSSAAIMRPLCFCGDCGKVFPAKKVKAVDCVAAGDTFNGALAVALAEGRPVADAIAFAQKAAAISVTRPGAQSSVPYRREIK